MEEKLKRIRNVPFDSTFGRTFFLPALCYSYSITVSNWMCMAVHRKKISLSKDLHLLPSTKANGRYAIRLYTYDVVYGICTSGMKQPSTRLLLPNGLRDVCPDFV